MSASLTQFSCFQLYKKLVMLNFAQYYIIKIYSLCVCVVVIQRILLLCNNPSYKKHNLLHYTTINDFC